MANIASLTDIRGWLLWEYDWYERM